MSDVVSQPPPQADESGADPQNLRDVRVAGAVAAAISLSVLWLASALWRGAPFGPSALAEAMIRAAPGDVATFFIEALGSWARRLATLGAAGVSLSVGMEARVATAKRGDPARPALAGAILALLAGAASFVSPTSDPSIPALVIAVGAAYLAYFVAAGGTVLGWLARAVSGGPDTDVNLVAPAVEAELPSRGGFPDVEGISSEVTSAADHYVVDINLVQPAVEADDWNLRVFGAVDRELDLTFPALQRRFEVVQEYSVLCCVSNEVGGGLIGNSAWGGVRLADVLTEAGPRDGAFDVVFRAADGYSDSIPLELAMKPQVLLAVSQNDRPLTQEHGFPCRVRIPSIYGMKNVKWLESIEVVKTDFKGYWQERGWSDDATVRTQSRIDVAGEDRSARRGRATWIAGVAWAGDRGVRKVEVSTDGGSTWSDAQVRQPISEFSWSQWAYRWTPSEEGDAVVMCRATDGTGSTQTDDIAPPHPAGATGYHKVTVRVS